MDIALQWVETVWTKQSRGGKAAARRNALPIAFPLPDDAPPFVHMVRMHEWNGFALHASVARNLPEGVYLDEEDDRLRVLLDVGDRPAVRLHPGHSLRWQVIRRNSPCCGYPKYRLITLNVAYGEVRAETFLHRPSRYVDARRRFR